MAQSALADAHQTLIVSQRQHRAILDALAAGAGARAEKLAREHSNLAKRSLHSAAKREAPLRKAAGGNLLRLQLAGGVAMAPHRTAVFQYIGSDKRTSPS